MARKLLETVLDLSLLCLLVVLVQHVVKSNISFVAEHKKSIIHELEQTFIDQLSTAQRQIHTIEEHPFYGIEHYATIANLKNRLNSITEQYKTNSPALMLLGPIGSAAIVLKEEQLKKKLLYVINEVHLLLHTIATSTTTDEKILTVENGLIKNRFLLHTIFS